MGAITEERAVSALFLLSPPPPPSTPSSIYSSSTPPEQCVHAKGLTTQGITNTSVRMSVSLVESSSAPTANSTERRENISYCSCVCCVFFFFLPYFSKNSVACGNSLRRLCNYQFNRALWLLSEAQVNFRVVAKY